MAKGVQGRYFGSPSFLFLVPEDFPMSVYPPLVEEQMRSFYESLSEKDRRRYAAVEAAKLGRGGITYLSEMLQYTQMRYSRVPRGPGVNHTGGRHAFCRYRLN